MSQAYFARFFAALYITEGWYVWFAERVDKHPSRRLYARTMAVVMYDRVMAGEFDVTAVL